MPTMIDGKKNKKQVNGAQVTNIIKDRLNESKEIIVVVEHVNAMPGQGVTSMFNFGQSFGVIKGICSALSLPIFFVRPTKWKKYCRRIHRTGVRRWDGMPGAGCPAVEVPWWPFCFSSRWLQVRCLLHCCRCRVPKHSIRKLVRSCRPTSNRFA